jgi:glycogen synthase
VRIALVSREVYPYATGGIAPVVTAAARALACEADVTVFTSSTGREAHERMTAAGDDRRLPDAVAVRWIEEPDGWGSWYGHMHLYSARAHAALKDHYGDRGPDVIEFGDYLAEGFVTLQDHHGGARWLRDTTICVRLHTTSELCAVLDGHLPDDQGTIAVHDAERFCLRAADRILWPGGDVLGTYERYYGAGSLAPAMRTPYGFLLEQEPGVRLDAAPRYGERLELLYLGRAERRKGVQNLLRAFTSLEYEDVRLTLLGGDTQTGPLGGSQRAQLEAMASGDHRIRFLDAVPRDRVSATIAAAHVVVVPSLWECWPGVAREALQHNRPVLATPVGGLVDLVRPGESGWLTRDTGARALGESLAALAEYPDQVAELIDREGPLTTFARVADVGASALVDGYVALAAEPRRAAPPKRRTPPLLSVVVPYFQLDELFEETLASVREQMYPEIEIVLVNDGSLRDRDERVYEVAERTGATVVTQPNRGLGAARNFGIAASRGEFVLPLDADDRIEPEFATRCIEALEARAELAYATTYARYIEPDGTPVVDELIGYMPYGNWTRMMELTNAGGTCSAVLRRRVFEQGFRYSHDLTSFEDWFLYRELAAAGHHGTVIPEPLFLYRVRPGSMMRDTGMPQLIRIMGEMRAHQREASIDWTAPLRVAEPAA